MKPDEEGGTIARSGFNYQDGIAVGFLIEMLETPSLLKVHCETHDDVLLVRAMDRGRVPGLGVGVGGRPLDAEGWRDRKLEKIAALVDRAKLERLPGEVNAGGSVS